MVSDNLAQLQRLRLGETLEIPAPYGRACGCRSSAFVVDYSDQQGTDPRWIGRSFQQYWNDDSVNAFRVYLAAGRDVPDVKQRILERYAGERQVFVLTNGELKAYILEDHRPVVRTDVGADCGRGARRDSRHREHADRVDHRSAA